MDELLFYLDSAIVMWFVTQISFGFTVLVLGNVMMEYYEWGTYEQPLTTYQKTVNFIMAFLIGAGPFIYKKLLKYPWWKRKLCMTGSIIAMIVGSILFYQLLVLIIGLFIEIPNEY